MVYTVLQSMHGESTILSMIMDNPRKETAASTTTLSIHSNKNITHHLIFRYCDDGPVQDAGYFPTHFSGKKSLILQTEDGILGASILHSHHGVLIIRLSGLARSPPDWDAGRKAKNREVGHRLIISHCIHPVPRVCTKYPVLGANNL